MPLEPRLLELADRLIDFIKKEMGAQVVVCDETGTIVRATIRRRIGTVHAGALAILRSDTPEYAVTQEEAQSNPLVREGLNCPIIVRGRRVGTFGIAGSLFVARPVARVCALVLTSWLQDPQVHADREEPRAQGSGSMDRGEQSQPALRARLVRAVATDLARAAKDVKTAAALLDDVATAIDQASRVLLHSIASTPAPSSGPASSDDPDSR